MALARSLLLVLTLFFAQLAAGIHAVDHGTDNEGGVTTVHACQLCLAAHDLAAALPGVAVLPPVVAQFPTPEILPVSGRSLLPPPQACQRAPPLA